MMSIVSCWLVVSRPVSWETFVLAVLGALNPLQLASKTWETVESS